MESILPDKRQVREAIDKMLRGIYIPRGRSSLPRVRVGEPRVTCPANISSAFETRDRFRGTAGDAVRQDNRDR